MKKTKFLFVLFLSVIVLQSCIGDIQDLADPRDAIVKNWEVSDNDGQTYRVAIEKDANDVSKVFFTSVKGAGGFHNLNSSQKLYATLAGTSIKIDPQTIDDYKIEGTGVIGKGFQEIVFDYTVQAGEDPAEDFKATFGKITVAKKIK